MSPNYEFHSIYFDVVMLILLFFFSFFSFELPRFCSTRIRYVHFYVCFYAANVFFFFIIGKFFLNFTKKQRYPAHLKYMCGTHFNTLLLPSIISENFITEKEQQPHVVVCTTVFMTFFLYYQIMVNSSFNKELLSSK